MAGKFGLSSQTTFRGMNCKVGRDEEVWSPINSVYLRISMANGCEKGSTGIDGLSPRSGCIFFSVYVNYVCVGNLRY